MPRPFLITVSGVAGSGKTTAIRDIVDALKRSGRSVDYWRFRTLPCFRWLQGSSQSVGDGQPQSRSGNGTPAKRWTGYRRRPLTARATLTYLARIIAFTLFRAVDRPGGYRVSNRYFYDNFPQFTVNTRRQRFYRDLLRRFTPKPDLALLMVASAPTLAARRPAYSREYFDELAVAYRELYLWCDDVVEVSTEPGHSSAEDIARMVLERVVNDSRSAGANARV